MLELPNVAMSVFRIRITKKLKDGNKMMTRAHYRWITNHKFQVSFCEVKKISGCLELWRKSKKMMVWFKKYVDVL